MQRQFVSETSCFGDTDVGACEGCKNDKVISLRRSALPCSTAGMLAVFLLVLTVFLAPPNARAGEVELLSINFIPQLALVQNPNNPNRANRYWVGRFSDKTFTFDGDTYTVNWVRQGGTQVVINITPKFPPDGQDRSRFHLKVGTTRLDYTGYIETTTFNFNISTVSGEDNAWAGGAGWGIRPGARISITGPENPNNSLRLADYPEPPDDYSGRLEIFDATHDTFGGDNIAWKWVCNDNFGAEEAQVACRQLGLPTDGAAVWEMPGDWLQPDPTIQLLQIVAQLSQTPALLDDLDCDGDESRLIDCNHAGRGESDCTVSEAVGVTCPSQEESGDGSE